MKNVFQVVGYQNSGKTTLMEKLIQAAAARGARVASIKHHGHGGMPDGQKDSARHQQAGAVIAGVEGEGVLQIAITQDQWTLQQILSLYSSFPVDFIFIEGYKGEPYPKAVLIRSEEDLPLLSLSNIQCVISWRDIPEGSADCPVFRLNQEKEYLSFILRKAALD
ncbi:molybdopterin-guanine dinucleotide biosynthesis protein B [Domibacillus robiginosus]|uniref:molybdopterin-guanine dinucleotide biosynthesis protein B n=1 Tax=Domibacillus robiginosus TaxID=1071054 RepID=UPI00067C02E2|nr:molybdopterin-guanine dinucleotide biosynthesis protein B [Domibacillus robiginosus]